MNVFDVATKLYEGNNTICSYDDGNENIPVEIAGEFFNIDEEDGKITIDITKASGTIRIDKENIKSITDVNDMIEIKMNNGAKYILTGG